MQEFARLKVKGAYHLETVSPIQQMLYRDFPAEKYGLEHWGNGCINGKIDKLKRLEADIKEVHPDIGTSYDMHRQILEESDLEHYKVGDKVVVTGVYSWTALPFALQGTVKKVEKDGWSYAQFRGKNRLTIVPKGHRKRAVLATAGDNSDVKTIRKIYGWLPDAEIKLLNRQANEISIAEGGCGIVETRCITLN